MKEIDMAMNLWRIVSRVISNLAAKIIGFFDSFPTKRKNSPLEQAKIVQQSPISIRLLIKLLIMISYYALTHNFSLTNKKEQFLNHQLFY